MTDERQPFDYRALMIKAISRGVFGDGFEEREIERRETNSIGQPIVCMWPEFSDQEMSELRAIQTELRREHSEEQARIERMLGISEPP